MRQSNKESVQLGRRYLVLIGGQPLSLAEKQAFIAEAMRDAAWEVPTGRHRIRAPEPPQIGKELR